MILRPITPFGVPVASREGLNTVYREQNSGMVCISGLIADLPVLDEMLSLMVEQSEIYNGLGTLIEKGRLVTHIGPTQAGTS